MIENQVIYVGLAIAVLVLILFFLRAGGSGREGKGIDHERVESNAWDPETLRMAGRLFDRADHLWLRDTMKVPLLAREMRAVRKRLALRWLSEAQKGFRELVSRFRENPEQIAHRGAVGELNLLWLSVSFHVLVIVAKLNVTLFGPYVPLGAFAWPVSRLVLVRDFFFAGRLTAPQLRGIPN